MTEREPDFEDDKIRMWRAPLEGEAAALKSDETVLSLDVESEEIYESRVYGLKPPPELFYMLSLFETEGQEQDEQGGAANAVLATIEGITNSTIKTLAKRQKRDGRISFIMVITGPSGRVLIDRADLVREKTYRRVIRNLERELLAPGLVNPPVITSASDWERYAADLKDIDAS